MRTACYGLLLTALLTPGCVPKTFTLPDDPPAPAVQPAPVVRKHVPPVRPDQVAPENAAEKAQALEEELNSDNEAPPPAVEDALPAPKN